MSEKDIMKWFSSCKHRITITQSNMYNGYIGVATSADTADVFSATGEDKVMLLCELKLMLDGMYNKN